MPVVSGGGASWLEASVGTIAPSMVDATLLPKVALLGGLSGEQLALVTELLDARLYEPGGTVVEEGTSGRELFVIEEGTAEIVKRAPDGRETKIAQLDAGACFGEMALVGIMRRSATVRARSALRVLVLPYAKIARLAAEHPPTFAILLMNLARELCRRLQQADALLGEFGLRSLPPAR